MNHFGLLGNIMNYECFIAAKNNTICDNWMWEYPLRRNIEKVLPSLNGAKILEIGCGRGLITDFLNSTGGCVTGIDILLSKNWKEGAKKGIIFLNADSQLLPFRDNVFDIVISCSTLQYVDISKVLAEITRITKSQGLFLFHENMPYNPIILFFRCLRRVGAIFSASIRAYSDSIKNYLSPSYPFPTTIHLSSYQCYYLLSSICILGSVIGEKWAKILLGVDQWLINRIPYLKRFCWFCCYILMNKKAE